MHRTIRAGLVAVGLAAALATTAAVAQGPNDQRWDKAIRHAIQQIEQVRSELERVPAPDGRGGKPPQLHAEPPGPGGRNDYLGHRSKAIEHLNMAIQELQQTLVNDGRGKKDDKKDKKNKN